MLSRPRLLAQHAASRAAWVALETGRTLSQCIGDAFTHEKASFLQDAELFGDSQEARDALILDAQIALGAIGLPLFPGDAPAASQRGRIDVDLLLVIPAIILLGLGAHELWNLLGQSFSVLGHLLGTGATA